MLHAPLKIDTVGIDTADPRKVFDMSGRCAFAICTKGEFEIKILNEHYTVTADCMFACMPFITIELVCIKKPSEIIFGSILIKDVPKIINRWVNSENLSAIHNHPLVKIQHSQTTMLLSSINAYKSEYSEKEITEKYSVCAQLQQDIIDLHAQLAVTKVLMFFFTNISLEPRGVTPRDIVFQNFMLSLYTNFRQHRDVKFYSARSGVSEKYFSTLVRQLSGSSPSEWIEAVVAGEAKTMLGDSQHSIKEIASALNFPDAPTFTKYFQRITGITPNAYRKNI